MRYLLSILCAILFAGGLAAQDPSTPTNSVATGKPNILWLITDNCNLDFGCFGRQDVHTPHLDAIAADGVRYTRVFATAPVCAPSRSSRISTPVSFHTPSTGVTFSSAW